MPGQRGNLLLTYMVALAIPEFLAFNIDITNPGTYDGEQQDFFGYKVIQYKKGTKKGIIVSAPLQANGTGQMCKYEQKEKKCVHPPELLVKNNTVPVRLFGMTLAEDIAQSQLTVCSPGVAHECHNNTYLNSVCYTMTNELQRISSFKPNFQDCTKKMVYLVFLFDGSGSMREIDFEKNKDFIKNIMDNMKNTSIKFAAVQFATEYRTVFDYNDYQNGEALQRLKKEVHMKKLTNTHAALTFVLTEHFASPNVSKDATKVLILITDGDPSDSDKNNIIKAYDDEGIIRLVIGVNIKSLDKVRTIASDPKDKNTFRIEHYSGLGTILKSFESKIFNIEGSTVARAGELKEEMSQGGFSAVQHKDTLILGLVGSNNWRGSLLERQGDTESQIMDPQMKNDSYMGYSIAVGEKNNVRLYFSGGPRANHVGQLVLFIREDGNWTAKQRVNGEQIGSYFGAELCALDTDSDDDTDFLLVGAPLFYQPQDKTEGQLVTYSLTDEMTLKLEGKVNAPAMGRFGSTLACLADLNGDGLREIAVGAPLEDSDKGAVYIYLGDRETGIRSTYSQRIPGQEVGLKIRFFGLAIDGNIDLGEDGLPDVVVGSQGSVVVLRSRPVFDVTVESHFLPEEINTDDINCLANTNTNLNMANVSICFVMKQMTNSTTVSGLNISYVLAVDPERLIYRGFFSDTDRKMRQITGTYELLQEKTCLNYLVYMPICVRDTLTPVKIKLNITQTESQSAVSILNVDSSRQVVIEVPFEKECRRNNTCVAEFETDLDFPTETLLVAEDMYFNLTMKLSNHGDDSYNTSLTIHYPPGLSFSWMVLTKSTRPTLHSCDLDGAIDRTVCGINLPVYRSRSSATFNSSFHISTEHDWNETASITISAHSENLKLNSTGYSVTKSLPVQFEVNMAVTVQEDSITYLNFTPEDSGHKTLLTVFKVDNFGWKSFPITVSLVFPSELEHSFKLDNCTLFAQGKHKTKCIPAQNSGYCSEEKHCMVITSDPFMLEKESTAEFTFSGDVQFSGLKDRADNRPLLQHFTGESAMVMFKSFISVDYNKTLYVMNSQRNKRGESHTGQGNDPTRKETQVQVEFIIPRNRVMITGTGVGLGFLMLIIIFIIMLKLGCFKLKSAQDFEEEEAARAANQSSVKGHEPGDEHGPEAKSLLEKPEAGSTEQNLD